MAADTVAFELDGSPAAAAETGTAPRTGPARERLFDEGRLFLRGDADGAWRPLDLSRNVDSFKQPGRLTLTAKAPGLRSATLTLPLKEAT
ncbi:hypothetical protein [Streptomyces sp. NPDC005485]|uniref:hypothetical protein n=1 Tax=Streptomyces sp. NPDC005485 TaxID=3155591 RepID=UPI0033B2D9ED